MKHELSVLIMAAGKGTRMYSKKPKVLLSLGGIPFVAHPIHTVQNFDPERIVVIVGYEAESVKETLDKRFGKGTLRYALQAEQNGTAHAVMCAKDEVIDGENQILILSGDVPLLQKETIQRLLDIKLRTHCKISMLSFDTPNPTGYGRVLRDSNHKVTCIREHRDCDSQELKTTECNAGIYLVDKEFLFSAFERISNSNDQGEYYLTDIVELAYQDGYPTECIVVEDAIEVMGANDRSQVAQLEEHWLRSKRLETMKKGVTLRMPETIYIDYDVNIEEDVEVGSHCSLQGKTVIRSGSFVGSHSILENAIVERGTCLSSRTTLLQ